jgi:hypothetical protein
MNEFHQHESLSGEIKFLVQSFSFLKEIYIDIISHNSKITTGSECDESGRTHLR